MSLGIELLKIWQMLEYSRMLTAKELEEYRQTIEQLKIQDIQYSDSTIQERYRYFLRDTEVKLMRKEEENKQYNIEEKEKKFTDILSEALIKMNTQSGKHIVVIFSGTAEVQEVKGNRPIRMAKAFAKRNIPTLYSYWRWSNKELYAEPHVNEYLFQSPIDLTMKHILKIIRYPFQQDNKIFILGFPYPPFSKYIELLKFYGWKVIYDIRDDWEEFNKVGQAKWYIKEHEIYGIKKAHYVTAVSKALVDKFGDIAPVHLLPNALDVRFNEEECMRNENKTKIGYVGHLTESWLNWDAIIELAHYLPYYTIEVIGHSIAEERKVLPENIHYLGSKPAQEVIQHMNQWKVGLIPFKINKLTKAVDPIKVYEYLAMGLKVVSFTMPQIQHYPEVKTVGNNLGFIQAVKVSMQETFDYQAVSAFLKKNTWEERIDSILSAMEKVEKE